MKYSLFDIHSHLTFSDFDTDRESILTRMKDKGLGTITVGTEIKTSQEAVALAEQHEHIFATVGIHPAHDVHEDVDSLRTLAQHPKVVAIGECGLDYFRLDPDTSEVTKREQRELFEKHITLAKEHALPLMIHARASRTTMDAYVDSISILSERKSDLSPYAGNVHFFAGTVDVARQFLDLGFSLSFDGPITFAREYDEVIRFIPDDMIMAETDAPFASPAPFRGKRNEPEYVYFIVEKIATLRNMTTEACARMLTGNALRSFCIDGEVV